MTIRSTNTVSIPRSAIAPCGMNCRLCRAYIKERNACSGCRGDDAGKSKTRAECRIKKCEKMANACAKYCYACDVFPCSRLTLLDKRYRSGYGMSMIDNLKRLKEVGLIRFIESERERWTCPECGRIICVHNPQCLSCQYKWR